ncbi:MAG: hypothetical protein EP332_13425 [Bacteroidetes bacterium]|nr:MAG: hypothetical protein EP332_13425 [Bacteroidota bacterium]
MNHKERIALCSRCKNRKVNPQLGMVCSLTDEPPSFEESCSYFQVDPLIDYQTRMREEQTKKSTRSSKRGLRFALIGFPLIVLLGYGLYWGAEQYKNKLVYEEAERWSIALQAELEEHDNSIYDDIDLYQLMLRATHDGDKSAQATLHSGFSDGIKTRILFPFYQMGNSLAVQEMSIKVKDQRAFILYRISGSSGAFNYVEVEMKRVDGRLKIVDGYNFGTGDFFNDVAQSMTPDKDGNYRGRLTGYEQIATGAKLQEISKKMCAFNINGANYSKQYLNKKALEEKFTMFTLMPLEYAVNRQTGKAYHEQLISQDKGAQFRAFHAVLMAYYNANLKEFRAARAKLEAIIGSDNYLDLLELELALDAGETDACEKIESVRKDFLYDTRAYALQLKCAEKAKDTKKAIAVVNSMQERLIKRGIVLQTHVFIQETCPELMNNAKFMESLLPQWGTYDYYGQN